jgi:MFS family permease
MHSGAAQISREVPEPHAGVRTWRARHRVRILYAYFFLYMFSMWLPFFVLFLLERGLSLSDVGLVQATGWFGLGAALFPAGALADRVGQTKALAVAPVLLAASLVGLVVLPTGWPLVVNQLIYGVSLALFTGPYAALLYDVLREEGRADQYGRIYGNALGLSFVANAPAGLAGGALSGLGLGLGSPFIAHAVLLIVAVILALLVAEPARDARGGREGFRAVWRALKTPRARALLLLSALSAGPFQMGYAFSQPYLVRVGMPVWVLGPLETVRALTAAVASALGGRMPLHFAGRALFGAQLTFGVALGVLAAVVVAPSLALFPLIAAAGAVAFVVQKAVLNAEIETTERATVNAAQSFVNTIAIGATLWASLTLADRIGLQATLSLSALFFVGAFAVAFVAWSRTSH